MNSTLTAARAALYWGAKVQYGNEISRMACISETQILTDIDWRSISDCKLILRTVEQLTNEEECIVIGLSNLDPTVYLLGSQGSNKICFFKDEDNGFCTTFDLLPKAAADYLRKQKVDIDNAISDGWAVKDITNK